MVQHINISQVAACTACMQYDSLNSNNTSVAVSRACMAMPYWSDGTRGVWAMVAGLADCLDSLHVHDSSNLTHKHDIDQVGLAGTSSIGTVFCAESGAICYGDNGQHVSLVQL